MAGGDGGEDVDGDEGEGFIVVPGDYDGWGGGGGRVELRSRSCEGENREEEEKDEAAQEGAHDENVKAMKDVLYPLGAGALWGEELNPHGFEAAFIPISISNSSAWRTAASSFPRA